MAEQFRTIGASIALITRTELGKSVLAVQRTNNPAILYPGHWELPGGGANPGEPAAQCAQREFYEETGIWVPEGAFVWQALYRSRRVSGGQNAFFAAHMEHDTLPPIRLSDEAQAGGFLPIEDFIASPAVVPAHVIRLVDYERRENGSPYLRHPTAIDQVA